MDLCILPKHFPNQKCQWAAVLENLFANELCRWHFEIALGHFLLLLAKV
jgi:hypothetical protein